MGKMVVDENKEAKRKSINKQRERPGRLFIISTGQMLTKRNRLTDVSQRDNEVGPS